jgi:phytoene dehydrogenase-like protein
MKKDPVIIVGAGLAGLACARTLAQAGESVLVLEQKKSPGGRVESRRTESGFLIDEGFQVLLSSYPELTRFVSLEALELKKFKSGAYIFNGSSMDLLANPMQHPETLLSGVLNRLLTLTDKALVLKLLAVAQLHRSDAPLGQTPTIQYLREFGLSEGFIENFWRPFLTGVFLDPKLSIGSDYFKFLLRCFGGGAVTLPARGMQELPRLIAEALPQESLRYGAAVRRWSKNQVELESGETLAASRVVCAFSNEGKYREVTTHYFTLSSQGSAAGRALEALGWDGWLVLIPQHLGYATDHLALLSSVAPDYSRDGRPLLSVSVVGQKNADLETIEKELALFAGRALPLEWVATTRVPRALPVIEGEPNGLKEVDGVVFCGDALASPSINGALRSGRLAAEHLLK